MKKIFNVLFALLAVFLTTHSNGQNFVNVTKSNYGQTISLSTNQVLEIQLPRVSSAGYAWYESVSSADKNLQPSVAKIDDEFIHNPYSGKTIKGRMVGQSGTQVLRYAGNSQGTTELTLELRRPWEKNKPAIDNFTITVVSDGKYTGNYAPSSAAKQQPNSHTTLTSTSLPSHYDWRSKCTPIADQQQCGDCWAYAGCGVFESNIKIIDDSVRDISEEYLTNCDTEYYGCNGGNCPLDYWLAPKGAVYESEDPWTTSEGGGTTGTCGGPYVYHETINSWAYVPGENVNGIPPDARMKEAIYYYGPIWVAVDASSAKWQSYTSGIFTENNTNTDHAVCLVGWVDSAAVSGGGYWIVRNSWGASWGISGYMFLSYGSDAIGTDAAYMIYKCKNNDFQMSDIKYPVTACGLTNAEHISAQITYNGCNTIPVGDTLFTGYKADNGSIINDTIILVKAMSSGDTLNFTYLTTADFSALGTHSINCWIKFRNDTMPLNDSLIGYTFVNKLHQNFDVGVSAITSPLSTCHMTHNEVVAANVMFYGCDSLAAGRTMVLAYNINGGTPVYDTFLIPHTIMPGATFNHVFTKTADLSTPGNYTFDAWTIYNTDTIHSNDMYSGYVVKNTPSIGYDTIGFEESNIHSILLIDTTKYSHAWVTPAAKRTGTEGFQMTGGNPMDYYSMLQIPDSTNIWTINGFISAKLNFCVDATGWSGFSMRFDLRQTDGGVLYAFILGAGDYTKASSLRVLINGVQVSRTFNPLTDSNDPWASHYITVDSMAGKQFTVTIETRNISKDTFVLATNFTLDNAYIDNVCFSPTSQLSVRNYNENLSLSVYPNPFNDMFTVMFDADKREAVTVEITDMLGRTVSNSTWNVSTGANKLDLNSKSLPAGMYMLKVTSSEGFAVKNIVKQ